MAWRCTDADKGIKGQEISKHILALRKSCHVVHPACDDEASIESLAKKAFEMRGESHNVIIGVKDSFFVAIRLMKGSRAILDADDLGLRALMFRSAVAPPKERLGDSRQCLLEQDGETGDLAEVIDSRSASNAVASEAAAKLASLRQSPPRETAQELRKHMNIVLGKHWHVIHGSGPFSAGVMSESGCFVSLRGLGKHDGTKFLLFKNSSPLWYEWLLIIFALLA